MVDYCFVVYVIFVIIRGYDKGSVGFYICYSIGYFYGIFGSYK